MPAYDVAIIGSGPGGYVAAIRAAQLGLSVVIIEKDNLGGLCLNWGCIPSKALLTGAEAVNQIKGASQFGITYDNLSLDLGVAVDRSRDVVAKFVAGIETLMKQHKITVVQGKGRLTSASTIEVGPADADMPRSSGRGTADTSGGATQTIEAKNIIIATGAVTRSLPNVTIDGERVITSREALARRELPASIVIVGGGPIGVEFGYYYKSYGADVTIVEFLEHLLPNEDVDVSRQLERAFKQQGINIRTSTRVDGIEHTSNGVTVSVTSGDKTEALEAEVALVGVGFGASSEGLGLAEIGVEMERGWVKIDDYGQTSVPGVWAVGDVTGRLLLAHVASHQGVTAVEKIAGHNPPALDYDQIPRAVYCQPQVASLGLTEDQAKQRGMDVRSARFPFRANGKAMATGDTDGFVKIVADRVTGAVVGYHMIGHGVTELLGEASLGSVLGTGIKELAYAVHAHPTLSEALKEAALAITGEAVHYYAPRRD